MEQIKVKDEINESVYDNKVGHFLKFNKQPLVSVVIPVYNRANLISRTLTSVAEQTYTNTEVILVDDCSVDSALLQEKIKQFDCLNITYIRHEVNLHGGAARNTGIKAAKGMYIAFLDSDDTWLPNKLALTVEKLEETKVDFVYSKLTTIGENNLNYPNRGLNGDETLSDYLLVNGGSIQTSTIVIKAQVAKSVLFDESLVRFQDYDFVVSLEKYKALSFFVDVILVHMYDDDQAGRISNSYNPEPAIYWITKVRADISEAAYLNFYLNRVVRYLKMSGNNIKAIKLLLNLNVDFVSKLKWGLICLIPRSFLKLVSSYLKR